MLPYAYAVGVRPAAIVTEPMDGYLTGCAVHTSGVTWTCTGGVGGERAANTYKCSRHLQPWWQHSVASKGCKAVLWHVMLAHAVRREAFNGRGMHPLLCRCIFHGGLW